jgi:hypothetical protein
LACQEGGFVACFPLNVLIVHSPKHKVVTDDKHQISIGFTLHETIRFWTLEFIADCFSSLSLSAKENDSAVIFMGMAHCGSPSMHAILKDSVDKGDTASRGGAELRLSHHSKMQHGNTDYPHHDHATAEGHSNASYHCDGPATDYRTAAKHQAPF